MSDKDEEDVVNMRPPETESHGQTDSDIEAKLATVKDQKEAKRLKRYGHIRIPAIMALLKASSPDLQLAADCENFILHSTLQGTLH